MGMAITTYTERNTGSGYEALLIPDLIYDDEYFMPFGTRRSWNFAFLADVCNSAEIEPISAPRGLPEDVSAFVRAKYDEDDQTFNASWLTVAELLAVNYHKVVENKYLSWSRGREIGKPDFRWITELHECLSDDFFKDLLILKLSGADRIVLWFDS